MCGSGHRYMAVDRFKEDYTNPCNYSYEMLQNLSILLKLFYHQCSQHQLALCPLNRDTLTAFICCILEVSERSVLLTCREEMEHVQMLE